MWSKFFKPGWIDSCQLVHVDFVRMKQFTVQNPEKGTNMNYRITNKVSFPQKTQIGEE